MSLPPPVNYGRNAVCNTISSKIDYLPRYDLPQKDKTDDQAPHLGKILRILVLRPISHFLATAAKIVSLFLRLLFPIVICISVLLCLHNTGPFKNLLADLGIPVSKIERYLSLLETVKPPTPKNLAKKVSDTFDAIELPF